MAQDSEILTGTIVYRNIIFNFVLFNEELRLIPPLDKEKEVFYWKMTTVGDGVYTGFVPLYIEDEFLIGKTNDTYQKVIFIIETGKQVSCINSTLFVSISAYITISQNYDLISRISFRNPEIDYIFSNKQALDISSFSEDGVISINTKPFIETTSNKQSFFVDDKELFVSFGISRTTSQKVESAPLMLQSTMFFDLEPSSDYLFIYRLTKIATKFIQYLCYRNDISLTTVELSTPYENDRYLKFASLFTLNNIKGIDVKTMEKGHFISQPNISGFEGKILTDIAYNKIYLKHLPESYLSGKHIDAARFVMITAAFEWEFRRSYPFGIPKSETRIAIEEEVIKEIDKLINGSSGEIKKKYKFLRKAISFDSLQNEIEKIGTDLADIIDRFGDNLYSINNEKLVYTDMGKRLADQRNSFAHGKLDEEFIGLSLLDLIFLEIIIYAIQLNYYGVQPTNIKKSINSLFQRGFAV